MKHIFITITVAIALSSCGPMYQVVETSAPGMKLDKENYVFENSEIKVSYNLWSYGGQISFVLTNKMDEPLYIDWNKSHFIYNGVSYEYWYDSEESKSFYSSITSGISEKFASAVNLSGKDVYGSVKYSKKQMTALSSGSKFKPKQIIHLPPKSSIIVSKFSAGKSPYYTCAFPIRYKMSKIPDSTSFSKETSPLLFRNYLTYAVKENFETAKVIDNEFYVSTVYNMNLMAFQGKSYKEKYCDMSGYTKTRYVYPYPYRKPNAFYIKVQ